MTNPLKTTNYTASEARTKLYSLIKTASHGTEAFEINLRGSDPVMLISKAELESWLETIDVMSNPEEVSAIKASKNDNTTYDLDKVAKNLGLTES